MDDHNRSWAEVDLSRLEANYNIIRKRLTPGCKYMAVVKANAYGHGAAACALRLQAAGADAFGVACLGEAQELRDAGITAPILIFGYTNPSEAPRLASLDIIQAVFSADFARALSEAALRAGVSVRVHIKINTGMNRLGFDTTVAAFAELKSVYSLPGLIPEGIFTHFAVSDEISRDSSDFTNLQFARFNSVCRALISSGINIGIRHCCNSAAAIRFPQMHLDMVRIGIAQYGLYPSKDLYGAIKLYPIMALYSLVAQLRTISEADTVSYGRTFRASSDTRVATVPIGYADGYRRELGGKAMMLLRGVQVPVIGRVCMDQLMLDVSDVADAAVGDTVTIVSPFGPHSLSFDAMAEITRSINYEQSCLLGARIPRRYIG